MVVDKFVPMTTSLKPFSQSAIHEIIMPRSKSNYKGHNSVSVTKTAVVEAVLLLLHGDRRRTIFSCQSFVCCHVQTCHLHTSSKSAANSRYFNGQPGVLARHISAVMEISYVRVRRTGRHVKWAKGKMKTFNALVNIKIRSFFLIDARKKYF